MKRSKKGFTLAELLVVVAIIAVLVAVAIPVFSSSTKKAEEAVEIANARSTYAEFVVQVVDGSYDKDATNAKTYGDKTYTFAYTENATGDDTWTITVSAATGSPTIYNNYSNTTGFNLPADGKGNITPAAG